ncbi:ABC transporter permease [Phycisphaerales bacterium AB-hyl4]|uniref:ABC transporter permease n=1 Tax=Natronomicrosphaera hydrolytica TaxID=3242702 RepID=A0ABV4U453_9BACT
MFTFLTNLFANKAAAVAAALLAIVVVLALAAPLIAPYGPDDANYEAIRAAPNAQHWLGTDNLGRDILSRIIYGARISLQVAGISVSAALLAGMLLGLLAGYFGGWLDEILSRIIDTMFAFPDIVLALVIVAVLGGGEGTQANLTLAIAIVYTPIFARIARGAVLSVKGQPFVEAAIALGTSHTRIILRHITPNILAPLTVQVTLSLAFAILAEAALSFLGLGVEQGKPSWGRMLLQGRDLMPDAWWVAVFPGVAITLTVLSFNLLGDGLRDALDPRHTRAR